MDSKRIDIGVAVLTVAVAVIAFLLGLWYEFGVKVSQSLFFVALTGFFILAGIGIYLILRGWAEQKIERVFRPILGAMGTYIPEAQEFKGGKRDFKEISLHKLMSSLVGTKVLDPLDVEDQRLVDDIQFLKNLTFDVADSPNKLSVHELVPVLNRLEQKVGRKVRSPLLRYDKFDLKKWWEDGKAR